MNTPLGWSSFKTASWKIGRTISNGTNKDFLETIRERAQQEPRFRKALLREAIELMLSGDEKTSRAILPHLQSQEGVNFELRARRG